METKERQGSDSGAAGRRIRNRATSVQGSFTARPTVKKFDFLVCSGFYFERNDACFL